jgi:hypothetical protein
VNFEEGFQEQPDPREGGSLFWQINASTDKYMSEKEVRKHTAKHLKAFAESERWGRQLWSNYQGLRKVTALDQLLSQADEELIHYSGCLNSWNGLGRRVSSDASEISKIRDTLRRIASNLEAE